MTHSGSNSSAFRKHLTPSDLLKAKHQFKPRSNQRCVSGEAVEIILEWLPRLKRSILSNSSIARTSSTAAQARETSAVPSAFERPGSQILIFSPAANGAHIDLEQVQHPAHGVIRHLFDRFRFRIESGTPRPNYAPPIPQSPPVSHMPSL